MVIHKRLHSIYSHAIWTVLYLLILTSLTVTEAGAKIFSGKVICSEESTVIEFATIWLKGTTYGVDTDSNGEWTLDVPFGEYILTISAPGYETIYRRIVFSPKDNGNGADSLRVSFERQRGEKEGRGPLNVHPGSIIIADMSLNMEELDEVVVTAAGGVGRVQRSAFNAVAVDTKELRNTTRNLSDALTKLPGMKLRESGGVGSEMQLMLDGFSGNHIKIFIDGIPQEGVGSSFSLNNIPVNFAERIEVYKGVVPVGFGTDAIGGVINIVTNKSRRSWFLDASYSYGSFNTHKSYVNFGQTLKNGLMYEINAFQNYSDNNYWVDTPVEIFLEDGSTVTNSQDIYRVRRFNDTYHNEAIIGKIGLVDKKFADRLVFSLTFSNFYKEIQTGVRQDVVFGQKHRRGWSLMPSLEYRKRDLFTKGLDVSLTASYNDNITRNIDTSAYRYNWLGDKLYNGGSLGEQEYQNSEFQNKNWNASLNIEYHIKGIHFFTLNHVMNAFTRNSRNDLTSSVSDYTDPKKNMKNITGLSYRLAISPKWNLSVFGKYYNQFASGPVSTSTSGLGSYVYTTKTVGSFGYGAAGTWFIIRGLQAKLSYEKAYRLPTINELFGDEDLELGSIGLRPENSDNANLNISYSKRLGKHTLYAEGSLIYRNSKDYILRRTDTQNAGNRYASYENHGRVVTQGFNVSLRYSWSRWLSVGGTFSNLDVRNRERYVAGGTMQESVTYGARIPNQPYMFANADVTFTWKDCIWKGNDLTITYDNSYVHSFPLYWENVGAASSKQYVPTQFSHNLSISYSIKNGMLNFSLECVNLTDEKLYDNFSLQKAGRAFYGKVRVYLQGKDSDSPDRNRRHNHHKNRR